VPLPGKGEGRRKRMYHACHFRFEEAALPAIQKRRQPRKVSSTPGCRLQLKREGSPTQQRAGLRYASGRLGAPGKGKNRSDEQGKGQLVLRGNDKKAEARLAAKWEKENRGVHAWFGWGVVESRRARGD